MRVCVRATCHLHRTVMCVSRMIVCNHVTLVSDIAPAVTSATKEESVFALRCLVC